MIMLELLNKLDTSKENQLEISGIMLAKAFGFDNHAVNIIEDRLKAYYLYYIQKNDGSNTSSWAYFLDGKAVAISSIVGYDRNDGVEWTEELKFVSRETYKNFKSYVMSNINYTIEENVQLIDLNEDILISTEISGEIALLSNKLYYKGRQIEVVDYFGSELMSKASRENTPCLLECIYADTKKTVVVSSKDIRLAFNIDKDYIGEEIRRELR